MTEVSKKAPISLHDFKQKRDAEYIDQMKELFRENPGIATDLLIVSKNGHIVLAPDTMTIMEIVGILECAKHDLMFNTSMESLDEEEEDET